MFGNTDKPIEHIDNDTFGISVYIDGLCQFILNCDTPMTVSIQGDWGSGKTSMMNMIKSQISSDVYPIWFNTWQFSQFQMQNELTVSMLASLMSELNYGNDKIKKALGFLSGASKTAMKILVENVAGGVAADKIGSALDGGSVDYADEIKKLKSRFQEAVNEKLKIENKSKAVIFVDDLDRLQPARAVELLEVLKVFLDCENCVYILAVDYAVVTQGIRQKFGDMVDEEKGKSFFDKIIQLPFKMPIAQYDISKYVEGMLEKMKLFHDEKTISDYVDLIGYSIGCNPRSMKRLFNTYLLLDIISKSKPSKVDERVRQKLLFATICMQMEYDELYNYIVSLRDSIDSDIIHEISDNLINNDELKEEIGINDENLISRVSLFMKKFVDAIQLDDDENISDEEIENLKEILYFSTATSVNNSVTVSEVSSDDKKYRAINKKIVDILNIEIKKELACDFKSWLPRKNKGDRKISDSWGVYKAESQGIFYEFDYYLKTDYESKITTLNFGIYNIKPSSTEELFNLLGEVDGYNKLEWGYEKYSAVSFNSDDALPKARVYEVVKNEIVNVLQNKLMKGFKTNRK